MRIQLDLDPRLVWRIEDDAEKAHCTPGDIVRGLLGIIPDGVHGAVGMLHTLGLSDAEMAARLNVTPGYVASIRRGLGLAAHRRYPGRNRNELRKAS